jgi:cytochrome P450
MEGSHKRYGPLWTLQMMYTTFVFISEPELIGEVFNADQTVLVGGEPKKRLAEMMLGGHSLLLIDGSEHTSLRKLMAPPFHREAVERHQQAMARICESELDSWPLHEPISLLECMQTITLKVIMSAIFGVAGADEERLHARIRDLHGLRERPWTMLLSQISILRGNNPPQAYTRVRDALYAEVLDEIDGARRDPRLEERDDVLASLVRARHDDGSPLTDGQLQAQLITLLVQGHASTAAALTWALDQLIRRPEMLDRLRTEAHEGKGEYLDAVVKETLRLRPSIPFTSRLVKKPYQLGKYRIEPGITLAPNIYMTHHRDDLYPEPKRFRPERFLERDPEPYALIPFGGGERQCIGAAFAVREIKSVLRTLALRARFRPLDPQEERVALRAATFTPKKGLKAVLEERVPAAESVPAESS